MVLTSEDRLMLLVVLMLFLAIIIGLGIHLGKLAKIKIDEIKDIMERDFEFDG